MRAAGGKEVAAALAALQALEADHQSADIAHAQIDEIGRKWLDKGRLQPEEHARLRQLLKELATLYAAHIRVEDMQVFPIAMQALSEGEIKAVGREMAERRGIDLSHLPNLKPRCPTRRIS